MTTTEFSNEFDVLYNNIMSNAAPGLNEYEKSVFLTKAQDEIIFNYFNPNGNKYKEGFDNSPKRQIDFSELIKSDQISLGGVNASNTVGGIYFQAREAGVLGNNITITILIGTPAISVTGTAITLTLHNNESVEVIKAALNSNNIARYLLNVDVTHTISSINAAGPTALTGGAGLTVIPFDLRGQIFILPSDVLLILNESFVNNAIHYRVVPIDFQEYDRVMSKPFKEPLKSQVWRLIKDGATAGIPNVEIIPHSGDLVSPTYSVRYIKRPAPIVLTTLSGIYANLTINNVSAVTECELNPITHRAILDRAVELAKAAYTGDLKAIVELDTRNE